MIPSQEERASPEPEIERLRDALEGMVQQFAYWSDKEGGYWTGGLSALEYAFDVLGWDDPHPEPRVQCDEPGCTRQIQCGTPTIGGYRNTCSEHRPEGLPAKREAKTR